MTAVFPDK